jgi:hypothetical protein
MLSPDLRDNFNPTKLGRRVSNCPPHPSATTKNSNFCHTEDGFLAFALPKAMLKQFRNLAGAAWCELVFHDDQDRRRFLKTLKAIVNDPPRPLFGGTVTPNAFSVFFANHASFARPGPRSTASIRLRTRQIVFPKSSFPPLPL